MSMCQLKQYKDSMAYGNKTPLATKDLKVGEKHCPNLEHIRLTNIHK